MTMSFVAMNRLLEKRAGEDEAYRRRLTRSRKCTLSDGRALPDETLLEKLRSLGLKEFSRDWLDHFTRKCPSAQALAAVVTKHSGLSVPADQLDWVWIALVCLWERWFPDRPNFEMLDDWMQAGYAAQERDEPLETARLWLRVWRGIELLRTTFHIGSFHEFDEWFGGTQSVFTWVQDCSMALNQAALTDHSFNQERLAFCNAVLELAAKTEHDRSLIEPFRQDLAQSHAALGQYETLDRLCTEWLRDDPQLGWGWIAWSDAYFTFAPEGRCDPDRAERILSDGLAVPNLRDREYVAERLAGLYEETGRPADAAVVRERHGRPIETAGPLGVESRLALMTPDREDFSDLDAIITALDREHDGKLPEQALRAAQRHRAEITPRLIELIRQATRAVGDGKSPPGNGQLFALYLLTEFQAQEALPAILEAVSLPGEGPFELFGDAITEDLRRILAALAADSPDVVEGLIVNRSLNYYVRSQAVQTYLHWVRDGRLTREVALERLRHHLREAIASEDADLVESVVAELVSYSPREALPEIREAFRLGFVDSCMTGMDDVDRSIAEGPRRFQKELEWCRPTGVHDTVAELRPWAAFRDDDESGRGVRRAPVSVTTPADDRGSDLEDEGPWRPDITIRNTGPKVGRNEPCPCGSGKKYKKCCGAG